MNEVGKKTSVETDLSLRRDMSSAQRFARDCKGCEDRRPKLQSPKSPRIIADEHQPLSHLRQLDSLTGMALP
jgi:hypothetical protein